MQVRFNDTDEIYDITGFHQRGGIVILKGDGLPQENTSGFMVLQDGIVVEDYSAYRVKYNVLTQMENALMLSDSEDKVETVDNPAGIYLYTPTEEEITEDIDPLTNEELTAIVADLMYERDKMEMGL